LDCDQFTASGAAGGGTRRERVGWSFVIEPWRVKFSVSGPAIGGAKSGINFDPNDQKKKAFCNVGYKAVSPLLKVIMELVVI
jgi:glutamate dehydrogenase/leucine dehydrogenase